MSSETPDKDTLTSDSTLYFRNLLRTTANITKIVPVSNIRTSVPDNLTVYPWIAVTKGATSQDEPTGMSSNGRVVDDAISIGGFFLNVKDRDKLLDALRKLIGGHRDTMHSKGWFNWRLSDDYADDDTMNPSNQLVHIVYFDISNLLYFAMWS